MSSTVKCWHWMKRSPLTGLVSSSLVGGLALFSLAVHLYLHEWVLLNPVATGLAGQRSMVCVWVKTGPFQSWAGGTREERAPAHNQTLGIWQLEFHRPCEEGYFWHLWPRKNSKPHLDQENAKCECHRLGWRPMTLPWVLANILTICSISCLRYSSLD